MAKDVVQKSDDSAIINPRREKGEAHVPPNGLICIVPPQIKYMVKIGQQHGAKRHYLFNSNLLVSDTGSGAPFFLAGPAVGAPMAVLALEKLIALGARKILVYGCCGAVSPQLSIGDIFMPSRAYSEEGTSAHYPVAGAAQSDPAINSSLRRYFRADKAIKLQEGTVWTTDAPYRETGRKIAQLAAEDIMAVEMEMSALMTVAAFRGVKIGAAMVVSDELWHGEWKPGFASGKFRNISNLLLERLVDLMAAGGLDS